MNENDKTAEKDLLNSLKAMSGPQIGTLAFNLSAIAWIGLNVSFREFSPHYMPGSFVEPNILNIISGGILFYSCYLALLAIKKESLIPAIITFTFAWSLVATIIRNLVD